MMDWWQSLGWLEQVLYVVAVFLTVLLLLQIVFSLVGGGDDGDPEGHDGGHDAGHDGAEGGEHAAHAHGHGAGAQLGEAFARGLLSQRSVLAFLTLFSWGGALYLGAGHGVVVALALAAVWGLAAAFITSGILAGVRWMDAPRVESLSTAVGEEGRVYLDIPVGGVGEVRVKVAGRVKHVRARAAGDGALPAGTAVFVVRVLEGHTVEVVSADEVLGSNDETR